MLTRRAFPVCTTSRLRATLECSSTSVYLLLHVILHRPEPSFDNFNRNFVPKQYSKCVSRVSEPRTKNPKFAVTSVSCTFGAQHACCRKDKKSLQDVYFMTDSRSFCCLANPSNIAICDSRPPMSITTKKARGNEEIY